MEDQPNVNNLNGVPNFGHGMPEEEVVEAGITDQDPPTSPEMPADESEVAPMPEEETEVPPMTMPEDIPEDLPADN